MKHLHTWLIVLIIWVPMPLLRSVELFPGPPSTYEGTTSYKLGSAIVLCPKVPAPGRPWVLCPDIYPLHKDVMANMGRTQLELVNRGFHVVSMNLGNTFGAPDAIAKWDPLYTEMTTRYGLSQKVALMGLSRQGLAIARWAADHPGKVSCLYMDKAVCDFKSWPGGKYKRMEGTNNVGVGSTNDWASLQSLYHFPTEGDALAWKQNPIDLAPSLASNKVAIIYVAGEQDFTVPYVDNGARVERAYKDLGGVFKLIWRSGEGHHPHGLPDPMPVADFIEASCKSQQSPAPTNQIP
ncbi:MAG: hypothetical protein WCP60_11845 [bacterium]